MELKFMSINFYTAQMNIYYLK